MAARLSLLLLVCSCLLPPAAHGAQRVELYGFFEASFRAERDYQNPWMEVVAHAVLTEPDQVTTRMFPLFWDGGREWKFRFSPDRTGVWTWQVASLDRGLEKQRGSFEVVGAARRGSIRPMAGFPHHFELQDGSPFWFLGDTAWALYTDSVEERHQREAALEYIDARAEHGFNVLHSMLLSEAGWGNPGGPPFADIAAGGLNPAYWQEVDRRLAHANGKGIVCGLALAWGDKRKTEPFAWRRFPDLEARRRYARYVAARYSAYNVYFIVSGEWHGEVRNRPDATEDAVRAEFIELGDAIRSADPHGRMIAIHPMSADGSVREFHRARWMSFGDYQQNYRDLHQRALASRSFRKPVVNSEYGYYLRDQNGDGLPDKDNSTSLETMRHATWDIVMAGAYVITGFGTTYFGGNRDPGPFDLHAPKNRPWEEQIRRMRDFFAGMEWWKLEPHDELLRCPAPRAQDGAERNLTVPPAATYWCLAEPGRRYVVYARGLQEALEISASVPPQALRGRHFSPATGEFTAWKVEDRMGRILYRPPDARDWVLLLEKVH